MCWAETLPAVQEELMHAETSGIQRCHLIQSPLFRSPHSDRLACAPGRRVRVRACQLWNGGWTDLRAAETDIKCFTVCSSAHTLWRDEGGWKSTLTQCNYARLISTRRCLIRLLISSGCDSSHQVWWWTATPQADLCCKHTHAAATGLKRCGSEEADISFWFTTVLATFEGWGGIYLCEAAKCENLAECLFHLGSIILRFRSTCSQISHHTVLEDLWTVLMRLPIANARMNE